MTAEVRDSSFSEPTDAQLEAAKAAGVRAWCGYLATAGGTGLAHSWPKATFDRVKAHGLVTLAFVSGWDNPALVARVLQDWGLLGAVDVEGGGLRDVGPWIPGWLAPTDDQVALYGNADVHGYSAPAHILSAYPTSGDPGGEAWPSWLARPATPCGWQWAGSHSEFGAEVDSEWWDEDLLAWANGGSLPGPPGDPVWVVYQRRIRPVLITLNPEDAPADHPAVIPGPICTAGRVTNWNLSSNRGCTVQLIAWSPDGTPIGESAPLQVTGNQPNVKGPIDVSGSGTSGQIPNLGLTTGPFTLGVAILDGAGVLTVVLHDEAG